MASRILLVPRSIAAGTLLGLFGPAVVFLVRAARDGEFSIRDISAGLLDVLVLCGLPVCCCTTVGGLSAAWLKKEVGCAYLLVTGIVVLGWMVLMVFQAGGSAIAGLLVTAGMVNSWLSGWYTIRVLQTAQAIPTDESKSISLDLDQGVRSHFQTSSPKTDTEAIRASQQQMTEQP